MGAPAEMAAKPSTVSIVIPVYNGANYLALAIDSALSQTHDHIEVVVVNDGSIDEGRTAAIARGYGGRIRYIEKRNGGVSSALNAGIAAMSGEYFSWLSHDDLYKPAKVQRQMAYIESNPGVRVVGTGLDVIDAGGEIMDRYCPAERVIARNGREVMEAWIYGCSLLIHRTVFEEVGTFDEDNRTVQDLEYWLRIVARCGPIHLIPEVLCQWRCHDASDSFRLRELHFNEVGAFFHDVAQQYPIEFFARVDQAVGPRQRAETFEWLGEQARHRGSARAAAPLFRAAAVAYPNPTAKAFWNRVRKWGRSLLASEPVRA
jgi:glycosyltransferase involved in cell wall biosynthesis